MTSYELIKRLKKINGFKRVQDILVLAPQNDPFYAGSDGQKEKAEWFYSLWRSFGYTSGIHLRRMHYQVVSQGDVKKHNGLPYENTDQDWEYLQAASRAARYLGLISPDQLVDHRNPEPHIFLHQSNDYTPGWSYAFYSWYLPRINAELADELNWELPTFHLEGYHYSETLQPYHLEIWCEKSTMDDILLPLCERYGVNLITGLGFMSITSVVDLLKRVSEIKKPCRILYVSDFDPAGSKMPFQVARQIEFWLERYCPGADVKLEPVVLTLEQVQRYRLPQVPIKDTDRRKANFEEKYGEGAVELDALEALYPGSLAEIITNHIEQFRDGDLERKYREARAKAYRKLQRAWDDAIELYREQLEDLSERVKTILKHYQEILDDLRERLESDLAPYEEELNFLRQAIQKEIEELEVELPEMPEPEVDPDDGDWLFDSTREYLEQLSVYKKRQNGGGHIG